MAQWIADHACGFALRTATVNDDSMRIGCTAVRSVLDSAESLESRGLAGYVYTQVSDVEEELNGLMTYDRRLNKFAQ